MNHRPIEQLRKIAAMGEFARRLNKWMSEREYVVLREHGLDHREAAAMAGSRFALATERLTPAFNRLLFGDARQQATKETGE